MIQKIKLLLKLLQGSKHFEQLVKSTETRGVSHRRNSRLLSTQTHTREQPEANSPKQDTLSTLLALTSSSLLQCRLTKRCSQF